MRDPQRIDRILNLIAVIWRRNPDLRLGQLLVNINGSIFERIPHAFEDDDVEKNLTEFVMRINRKEEEKP